MSSTNIGFSPDKGADAAPSVARRAADSAPSRAHERAALRKLTQFMGQPRITVRLWDGFTVPPVAGESLGSITLRTRATLMRLLRYGDIAFGDEYAAGRIEIDGDLVTVLTEAYHARDHNTPMTRLASRLYRRKPQTNTLAGSREHIHHHYNISNDFYRLWLDSEMQYTCAYFSDPTMTLEAAQRAKMDHVCRKLQLKPGDRVAEAGCGWGGLARHMALNYGAQVTSWNISVEQIRFACNRAKSEGYDDRVCYVEDDYRNISGEFDVFVSIGMLEHVGRQNYTALGQVVNQCLGRQGRALIHTIGRNRSQLMNAWIEKRIFPGAYPPTLREMTDIVEPFGFSVLDIENLRLHYARTLEEWLQRFDAASDPVVAQLGKEFERTWRLYLAGSQAAFLAGKLQLFQMLFARERDNTIPWSRSHLYGN